MQDLNSVIIFVCFVLAYIVLSLCLNKFCNLSIRFDYYKTDCISSDCTDVEVSVNCVFKPKRIPFMYVPFYLLCKGSFRELLGNKICLAVNHVCINNNIGFILYKQVSFSEKIKHLLETDNGIRKHYDMDGFEVVSVWMAKDTSGPTEEEKKAAEERAERFHENLKRTIEMKMQIEADEEDKLKKLKMQAEIAKANTEAEAIKSTHGAQKIDAPQMAFEKMIEIVKEESADKAFEETTKMAFDSIAKHIKDKEQS